MAQQPNIPVAFEETVINNKLELTFYIPAGTTIGVGATRYLVSEGTNSLPILYIVDYKIVDGTYTFRFPSVVIIADTSARIIAIANDSDSAVKYTNTTVFSITLPLDNVITKNV